MKKMFILQKLKILFYYWFTVAKYAVFLAAYTLLTCYIIILTSNSYTLDPGRLYNLFINLLLWGTILGTVTGFIVFRVRRLHEYYLIYNQGITFTRLLLFILCLQAAVFILSVIFLTIIISPGGRG